jgi:two-component system sensor histidine kinase UhpB
MPPEVADPLMDGVERAPATKDPVLVEYELTLNEPRLFEARLVSIDDDRVLSIVRDMTDARRALERNRDLAGRLIASQEEERMRIARDLHDGICQEVAAVGVDVTHLRHRHGYIQEAGVQALLASIQQRTADVAASLRLLAHGLHATMLHQVGLVAALQTQCAEVERQHGVELTLNTDGDVEPGNRPVALSLFRIAQEALGNAVRHGRARRAAVSLLRNGSTLSLTITDDGIGFDVLAVPDHAGLGLVSMSERARLIRGKLNITSRRNKGTTVEVRVPLDTEAQAASHRDSPSIRGVAVRRETSTSGRGV